jgi:hypothetical protein
MYKYLLGITSAFALIIGAANASNMQFPPSDDEEMGDVQLTPEEEQDYIASPGTAEQRAQHFEQHGYVLPEEDFHSDDEGMTMPEGQTGINQMPFSEEEEGMMPQEEGVPVGQQ